MDIGILKIHLFEKVDKGFFKTAHQKKLKIKNKIQAKNQVKNLTVGRTFPTVCKTQEKTKITENFSSKPKVFQRVALF